MGDWVIMEIFHSTAQPPDSITPTYAVALYTVHRGIMVLRVALVVAVGGHRVRRIEKTDHGVIMTSYRLGTGYRLILYFILCLGGWVLGEVEPIWTVLPEMWWRGSAGKERM